MVKKKFKKEEKSLANKFIKQSSLENIKFSQRGVQSIHHLTT